MDYTNEQEARGAMELLYLAKDRKALLEISNNQKLAPQVRQYASGLLARPWLPWGSLRKIIMIVLFLSGALGLLITGNFLSLIFVLFALSFSPRLVAEFLLRFSRKS